jgi:hypothetical protein
MSTNKFDSLLWIPASPIGGGEERIFMGQRGKQYRRGGQACYATSIFNISRFSLSIPRFAISFFANRDQWAWWVGAKNAHKYYGA